MPVFSFEGKAPKIHPDAFVAETATIVGDVTIEAKASVWYNAVVRGDFSPVIIGEGANIQDGAVIHGTGTNPVIIGRNATVAHNCTIHGAVIGDGCVIAIGVTVLDGAKVGARTLVAAGAVVTPNTELPDGVVAMGVPAVVRQPLAGSSGERIVDRNSAVYRDLAQRHKAGAAQVP